MNRLPQLFIFYFNALLGLYNLLHNPGLFILEALNELNSIISYGASVINQYANAAAEFLYWFIRWWILAIFYPITPLHNIVSFIFLMTLLWAGFTGRLTPLFTYLGQFIPDAWIANNNSALNWINNTYLGQNTNSLYDSIPEIAETYLGKNISDAYEALPGWPDRPTLIEYAVNIWEWLNNWIF